MGFSNSRNQARQMVRHNHFLVNNKKVNIPSYLVRPGDVIDVKEKSRKVPQLLEGMETVVRRGIPDWIEVEKEKFRGTLKSLPNREDITMPIHEQLIVELYSK
jgi:small subunit ribosomal protein S4